MTDEREHTESGDSTPEWPNKRRAKAKRGGQKTSGDVEIAHHSGQLGVLWILWVLTVTAGWFVITFVSWGLADYQTGFPRAEWWDAFTLIVLCVFPSLFAGWILGALQIIALRRIFPKPGVWVLVFSASLVMGTLTGWIAFNVTPTRTIVSHPALAIVLNESVSAWSVIGVVQWMYLRRRVSQAGWWIVANAAAGLMTAAIRLLIGQVLVEPVGAILTGTALVWLVQRAELVQRLMPFYRGALALIIAVVAAIAFLGSTGSPAADASDRLPALDWSAQKLDQDAGTDGVGVISLAWSPDGTRLAGGGTVTRDVLEPGQPLTYEETGIVIVWYATTGEQLLTLEASKLPTGALTGGVSSLTWSPDGARLAAAVHTDVYEGKIVVWASPNAENAETGQELLTIESPHSMEDMAWSPDGAFLACASAAEGLIVWSAENGEQVLALPPTGYSGVYSVAWSPDGRRLASGEGLGELILWDAATGEQLLALEGHNGTVDSVAWSPGGAYLASVSDEGEHSVIIIWNAETWEPMHTLEGARVELTRRGYMLTGEGHTWPVASVSWSPDGTRLVSAGAMHPQLSLYYDKEYPEDRVIVWDVETGEPLGVLEGHPRNVSRVDSVAWSPDGTRLASASDGGSVIVWDCKPTGECE